MVYLVSEQSAGMAHRAAIDTVLTEGVRRGNTLELQAPLYCEIVTPWIPPTYYDVVGLNQRALDIYANQLISGVNPGFAYSYGNRFREDIDQVARVASILRSDRESRRAIIHTWRVDTDLGGVEVPCVQTIQFVLRNNKLSAVVYIRSNDILLAWGANAYGISALLAHMCCLVQGCTMGSITMISAIAHIYDKRDADIIRRVTNDLMDSGR